MRNKNEEIVLKFGGTPNSTAEKIKAMCKIIMADQRRRFVVVSAPGGDGRFERITVLLRQIYPLISRGKPWDHVWDKIQERFTFIMEELDVLFMLKDLLSKTKQSIIENPYSDFIESCGEYLEAMIVATFILLNYKKQAIFVDASKCIFFDEKGFVNEAKTLAKFNEKTWEEDSVFIFPGYYGTGYNGQIKTFPAGGSDITGAVVASMLGVEVYENWTDVSGFHTANPKQIKTAIPIPEMTRREARILAYAGAAVLQEETLNYLVGKNITLWVKNINDPEAPGTKIVGEMEHPTKSIVGIVGSEGFTIVTAWKIGAHDKKGFGADLYKVVADCGISYDHETAGGTDESGVIINNEELKKGGGLEKLKGAITKKLQPNSIDVIENVGVINTICYSSAVRFDILLELERNGIKIFTDMMTTSGQVIIAVKNEDLSRATRLIHDRFF